MDFTVIPREIIYHEILTYLSFSELYVLLSINRSLVREAFEKRILEDPWKFHRTLENANNPDLYEIYFSLRDRIRRYDETLPPEGRNSEYDAILYNLVMNFSYNGMRYYFVNHKGPYEYYSNLEWDPGVGQTMAMRECYSLEDAVDYDPELLEVILTQLNLPNRDKQKLLDVVDSILFYVYLNDKRIRHRTMGIQNIVENTISDASYSDSEETSPVEETSNLEEDDMEISPSEDMSETATEDQEEETSWFPIKMNIQSYIRKNPKLWLVLEQMVSIIGLIPRKCAAYLLEHMSKEEIERLETFLES